MKLGLVTHIFNEELLLPVFINWHKSLFDCVIVIDHECTDNSLNIIRETAPEWEIIPTALKDFQAHANDSEVMEVESYMKAKYKPDWIVTLNVTELIFTPNFKGSLEEVIKQVPNAQAFGMRSACLVDPEPNNSMNPLDHTWGYLDFEDIPGGGRVEGARRWRFIHNQNHGHYELGRHNVFLPHALLPNFLILYMQLAPYPLCGNRKLQIKTRIPESDKRGGLGFQHQIDDQGLINLHKSELERSYNLMDKEVFAAYHKMFVDMQE